MSHVRTQIRTATVAALAGIGTTVIAARVYPVAEDSLPVVLVYTNGEQVSQYEFGGLERRLEVVVEIVAQGTNLDAALDAILVEVEQALGPGLALVSDFLPTGGIEVSTSTEGSAPIGRLRLVYEAIYRTAYADPETTL